MVCRRTSGWITAACILAGLLVPCANAQESGSPVAPAATDATPSEPAADPGSTQPATSTAPADEQEADALNKQRIAEQLQAEASNRLGAVTSRLDELEAEIAQAGSGSVAESRLKDELSYWRRREGYERRRLEQADLQKRSAEEKRVISRLQGQLDQARQELAGLRASVDSASRAERKQKAEHYRRLAGQALAESEALATSARDADGAVPPSQQMLADVVAVEEALQQRLEQTDAPGEFNRYYREHYPRMRAQLEAERQLIDLMTTTGENIVANRWRQSALSRELADVYTACAEVLVPSQPGFWERHAKLVNSIKTLAAVIALSYGVKFVVWLVRLALQMLRTFLGRRRISVKRASTLVGFAGSIVKLFIWVFGFIAVLGEFGIDPANTAGAIGLIGLILAGMFQQLVIDFVKGLDVIAGGHYNVGDFVEVDGKMGHVVDFSVKYTRIRTPSGQEFSIPNSRCVPSRRFPEGFVDNYVDITLAARADEHKAKSVIEPVCRDLNRRLEPMREEPRFVSRFVGPGDQLTLRYRLRVLPGSGWVVTDYFVPAVKRAFAEAGITLAAEPTFVYFNQISTFRELFSRRLSEAEIIRQTEIARQPLVPDETPSASSAPVGESSGS